MVYLLIALWLFRSIRSTAVYTHWWQIKFYRVDKMKDFVLSEQSRNVYFDEYHIALFFSLAVYFLLPFFLQLSDTQNLFFAHLVAIIFLGESLQFASEILSWRFTRPKLTLKAFLIMGLSFVIYFALFWVFVIAADQLFYSPYTAMVLAGISILQSDLNAVAVMILSPLTQLKMNRLFKKAAHKRASMRDLIVIGVTGSYGKTSVKEFLAAILEKKFSVLKTEKNVNSESGVAKTILNDLRDDHEVFVCEMGAYKKKEIALCSKIAKPRIGILTGINEQHLSLFGSLENTVKAKWELIDALPRDGFAVFNGEDKNVRSKLKDYHGDGIMVGSKKGCDFMPGKVKLYPDKIKFEIEGHQLEASLLGKFNVTNLTMAIAVARYLGVKWEDIQSAVKDIKSPAHTMASYKIGKSYVIDDCYNVNPSGVEGALHHLKLFRKQQKVFIFPGIIELGKESKKIHEELGEMIGESVDSLVLTNKQFSKEIKKGALKGGLTREDISEVGSADEAVLVLKKMSAAGDCVFLFEGRMKYERKVVDEMVKG